ncbi:MAG TPA: complex I NDUFA9 subunit family protein [Rhizomicrobium sp.]|nr:complex I NDUFA9 subunit family protein [Rhizomicrobium sp.]
MVTKTPLVAVFGGSGFLGRYVVRALGKAGYRIRVGVRRPNLGNYLVPMGQVGQIQVVKANITNAEQVESVLSGADAVINLVGVLRQSGRQRFAKLHRDAPAELAKAAMNAGASTFVHVSAMGVSQNSPSLYARTKAEGELRVREAFPAATIFRPSLLFGPEDDFFNRFAGMARMSPFLPLIGGGNTKFQPVYVGDVATAIRKSVTDPAAARGRTYELGGPTIYTFRQLMELTLRETCRTRTLLPIPFGLASFGAAIANITPWPPITPDQVKLLKSDNVMTKGALGLGDLAIEPDSVEAIVPTYLWRFRAQGQFQLASGERFAGS